MTLQYYENEDGKEPFIEWLEALKDQSSILRIRKRLRRMESNNLGNYKSVGSKVFELKLDFGPGFRIYFAFLDKQHIILLLGGTKKQQQKDINQAKQYWADFSTAHKQ